MTVTASRNALFISHATPEDNHFARWLGARLSAMGYEVWADVMRLHGGVDWARELETALRHRAVKVLLVCTAGGLEKQGVRNEIEIAAQLSRQLEDSSFIIPLRVEAYDTPFRIAQSQYIDFKGGWARGLVELAELLRDKGVPRGQAGPMEGWLASHAQGADRILDKPEPLVSNWLEVRNEPARLFYCEPRVGFSLDRFQHRQAHLWPAVPHRGGVLSFAAPGPDGNMGGDLPAKEVASVPVSEFLDRGWPDYGVDPHQARRVYADIGSQAFDKYCASMGLQGFMGAGGRLSWWGDIKTAPLGQVKFDWNFRRGSRQVIGHSGKRGVHWHYAVNAQLRTYPLHHLRLSARLVFSENGLDPITDKRRAHTLRRSLAKGWRNARWRDMLCAYLWWISEGKGALALPVAADTFISATLPPMQFSCPISVAEAGELPPDEDDPDVPVDQWSDDLTEETEE